MRPGIVVNALGISQMSFQLTTELNKLSDLDDYWDIILFYHTYDMILKPPFFAMLQEEELWGFNAPCMATDLETAQRLQNCPCPNPKLFYVWDLEWTQGTYNIDEIASIYMDPKLQLVARSDSHAKAISSCWKEPIDVIEGFEHDKLIKLFERTSKKV